ncbi:uncharacterized protein RHOBADRAFT_44543 [Rhodotorula graminis WP1]|uniref:START domain-containing protein n=1 Tax=Rhodotorula graminis (strain WP1) TaxID=578459 RepID=A0A194S2S0_RHOGW|nr:uncharacterized protein RHOBADRAFT_44543 [Rhodotorula graminis WP1]KPV75028.1 hypothetical protein RHOBADRAFT_44543 [Rhodotorula graminis WP1]
MATSTQVAQLQDTQKSVLSLLLSLSPLYFLVTARSKLGLDGLHVGLLQVLLLLVLRAGLDLIPSGLKRKSAPAPSPAPAPAPVGDVDAPSPAPAVLAERAQKHGRVEGKVKERTRRRRIKAAPAPAPPPLFAADKLDETVANFLHITAPAFLSHIAATPTTSIPSAPLSEWKSTFKGDNVEVLQHPKLASLFGICATFPDVPIRQLFQVLQDVGSRSAWDSMSEGADEIERFEVEGRKGNCLHMRMKGMAMVKAKDLVLLSVASKLPTADDEPAPGKPVADKVQIFAATTSVDHERVPATPAYNRMQLSVSGFLIEEVGAGGSKIVQITDLSGLGSWIPGAVLRTITQTMLPKSLVKLGATAAATTNLTADFPPPTLGVYAPSPAAANAADDDGDASSDYASDSDASSTSSNSRTDPTSPSDLVPSTASGPSSSSLSSPASARDVNFLLVQLRNITSRLAALETLVASPQGPSSGRPWYALGLGSGTRGAGSSQRKITGGAGAGAGETSTALLGPGTLGALATVGSAAAAAVAVAAVAAWGKRRR